MSLRLSRRYAASYVCKPQFVRTSRNTTLLPSPHVALSRQHLRHSHVEYPSQPTEPPLPPSLAPKAPTPLPSYLSIPEDGFPSIEDPKSRYRELVAHGTLREDEHQKYIIDKLQRLHDSLKTYNPPMITTFRSSSASLFDRLFGNGHQAEQFLIPEVDVPKGLYLFGDVGTGKSMLMDLFYATLPPNVTRKRRVHFHSFMIDVHKRIHAAKAAGYNGGDPIMPVARDLANEANVLCFDEFQVTDIVDAMILRRLFECLLEFGVVCVITSNRHPDDLYKNGIQRSSFIPCIELLKNRFDVTDLDSATDYRKIPRALSHVYYFPLSKANRDEVNKIFHAITSSSSSPVVRNRELPVWGRKLLIPESTDKIAKFTFQELCGNPLSAADYLQVTDTFPTIFVLDVPKMNVNQKDMARRFITFIDACYESKTKLFISSEVPIYKVFSDEVDNSTMTDHMRSVMDDLGLSDEIVGASSIFTGEEEIFAFARACSRLVQMGTKEWAQTARA